MAKELNDQMENKKKNLGGRPGVTQLEKEDMVRKLDPYLKSGISIRKALSEAGISKTTFYKLMDKDEWFRDTIERQKQYLSVLLNSSIVKHLHEIVRLQNGYADKNGNEVPPKKLKKVDIDFLWKFATTSNLTKEEYGDRKAVSLYDPEAELQRLMRIIDQQPLPSKEILHN